MKVGATKRLVLDASVTLAWCFPEESTTYTEAVLDVLATGAEAMTPSIWPFEVANALLVAERRKRLAVAQVTSVLQRIASLPIFVEPVRVDRAFGPILLAARDGKLTEYDAAYLELALREGLPLASLDDRLRRAARNTGIAMVTI
jgi:predicted nucleic acid-binding protein